MTEPEPDIGSYHDLANLLREQIRSGELAPGAMFPSEAELVRRYGVGRDLVKRARHQLRSEGLLTVVRRTGLFVRDERALEPVRVPRGSSVRSRMPTPEERREMRIGDGVPVLVLTGPSLEVQVYPADRFFLTFR